LLRAHVRQASRVAAARRYRVRPGAASAGAALAIVRHATPREQVLASTAMTEKLEELQLLQGQRSGMDAAVGQGTTLIADPADLMPPSSTVQSPRTWLERLVSARD
jgi:hypothetical protein